MALQKATIISHTMELKFTCTTKNKEVQLVIDNPNIIKADYFANEDDYITVKCPECPYFHTLKV